MINIPFVPSAWRQMNSIDLTPFFRDVLGDDPLMLYMQTCESFPDDLALLSVYQQAFESMREYVADCYAQCVAALNAKRQETGQCLEKLRRIERFGLTSTDQLAADHGALAHEVEELVMLTQLYPTLQCVIEIRILEVTQEIASLLHQMSLERDQVEDVRYARFRSRAA